jgi:hypothetical protein
VNCGCSFAAAQDAPRRAGQPNRRDWYSKKRPLLWKGRRAADGRGPDRGSPYAARRVAADVGAGRRLGKPPDRRA